VIGKMKVSALLESLPGVGKIRARQIMGRLGITDSRRVRGLGASQRAALERQFGDDPGDSPFEEPALRRQGAARPEAGSAQRQPAAASRSAGPFDQSVLSLYLSSGHEHQAVEDALEGVLDAYGFEVVQRLPGIQGSWFRKFLIQTRAGAPSAEEYAVKLARAVELQALGRPQAQVDARRADAVARLLTALDKEENASIQIGPMLLSR
jgi:ribosomal protein S13